MAVSGLCGIHCALVPLLFLAMPSLQAALFAFRDPRHGFAQWLLSLGRWEGLVVCTAIFIAAVSMGFSYLRHRRMAPALVAVVGAVLLIAAIRGPGAHSLALHSTLAVAGGSAMCAAHLLSLNMSGRMRADRAIPADAQ